jgi:hypothetical protein
MLQQILAQYDRNPLLVRRQLTEWVQNDAPGFARSALPVVAELKEDGAHQFVILLLLKHGLLLNMVCDDLGAVATEIMKRMIRMVPLVDVKLLQSILARGEKELADQDRELAEKLVSILNVASPGCRLLPMLVQLLRHDDSRLRSKTVLTMGVRNSQAEGLLTEEDPRVRANGVEAFWGVDTPRARKVFRKAMEDPNNRVQGNGLLGLLKVGDRGVVRNVIAMTRHPDAKFRATAAWVMGQSGELEFKAAVHEMMSDADALVRANAEKAYLLLEPAEQAEKDAVRLRVNIGQVTGLPDGRRRLWVGITTPHGLELDDLREEHIQISENGHAITELRLMPRRRSILAMGFAMPVASGSLRGCGKAAERALMQFLEYKRESDYCAVVRYLADDHDRAPSASPQFRGLGLPRAPRPGTTPADKAKARFSKTPAPAQMTLSGNAALAGVRPNLVDAIPILLDGAGGVFADLNLLVLANDHSLPAGSSDCQDALRSLLGRAEASGVMIHGILLPGASPETANLIETMCRGAGGVFFRAETEDRIPHLVETAYTCLSSGQEILYVPPDPQAIQVEVTCSIQHKSGQGEDRTTLSLFPAPALA